jgi:hypothetical protein
MTPLAFYNVNSVLERTMGDYDPSLEGEEVDLGGGEGTFFPPKRSQSHPGGRPQPPTTLRLGMCTVLSELLEI